MTRKIFVAISILMVSVGSLIAQAVFSAMTPTVNPYPGKVLSSDVDNRMVLDLLFCRLFTWNTNDDIVPELVASHTSQQVGKDFVIDLTLRNDFKWSDGTAVTSSDVKFSMDVYKSPQSNLSSQPVFRVLRSVQVVSPTQLKITLSQNVFYAFGQLGFYILPAHKFSNDPQKYLDIAQASGFLNAPISSGLYIQSRIGKAYKYSLNTKMSKTSSCLIQEMERRLFLTPAAIVADLNSKIPGALNIAPYVELTYLPSLNANKNLTQFKWGGYSISFLAFNHRTGSVTANATLRKAIYTAINRQQIVRSDFLNSYTVINGPFPAVSPKFDPTIKDYKYDVAQAKSLIAGASVTKELRLIAPNTVSTQEQQALVQIKQYLEAIGIKTSQTFIFTKNVYEEKLNNGDFDLYYQTIYFDHLCDITDFFLNTGSQVGNQNFAQYRSDPVNKLLQQASSLSNPVEYANVMHQINQVLVDDAAWVFLWSPTSFGFYKQNEIQRFLPHQIYCMMFVCSN